MSRVRVNEKPNSINTLSVLHAFSLLYKQLSGQKTEEALRVRYKASGGERDTGVVAGTFFALNIYFLNLPIENPINIGGRGTRVAH